MADYLYASTKFDGVLDWLNVRSQKGKFAQLDKSNTNKYYQGPHLGENGSYTEALTIVNFTSAGVMYVNPSINPDMTELHEPKGNINLEVNDGTSTIWSINLDEFANRPLNQGRIRINVKGNVMNQAQQGDNRCVRCGFVVSNNITFTENPGNNQYVLNWVTETKSLVRNPFWVGTSANYHTYIDMDVNMFISGNKTLLPWSRVTNANKWYFKILWDGVGDNITPQAPFTLILHNAQIEMSVADDELTDPNVG